MDTAVAATPTQLLRAPSQRHPLSAASSSQVTPVAQGGAAATPTPATPSSQSKNKAASSSNDLLWSSAAGIQRSLDLKSSDILDVIRCPLSGKTVEDPVLLSCLHSVGRGMLAQAATGDRAICCPVCREITVLDEALGVNGLPSNTGLAQFVKTVTAATAPKGGKQAPQPQPVVLNTPFGPVTRTCPEHEGQPLSLFDLVDQKAVCPYCLLIGKNRNHDCVPLVDAAKEAKSDLLSLARMAQEKEGELLVADKQLEAWHNAVDLSAARSAERIQRRFQDLIMQLLDRQQHLLDSLEAARRTRSQQITEMQGLVFKNRGRLLDSANLTQQILNYSEAQDVLAVRSHVERRLLDVVERGNIARDPSLVRELRLCANTPENAIFKVDLPHSIDMAIENFGDVALPVGFDMPESVFDVQKLVCTFSIEEPAAGRPATSEGAAADGTAGEEPAVWIWPIVCIGSNICVGDSTGAIRVYHAFDLNLVATLAGHTGPVCALATQPSLGRIYSASYDGSVRAWSMEQMACVAVLSPVHPGSQPWSLCISGGRLISGGGDGQVKGFDADTMAELFTISAHRSRVLSLCCAGEVLFTGSADFSLRIWDLVTGECLSTMQLDGEVWALNASSLRWGRVLAGTSTGALYVIDVRKAHAPVRLAIVRFHQETVRAILHVGEYVVAASCDGSLSFWAADDLVVETKEKAPVRVIRDAHASFIYGLARKGDRLYSTSDDGTVKIWDCQP